MEFLLDAIDTAFNADTDLSESVTGIYFEEADELNDDRDKIEKPYIVVHFLPSAPQYDGTFSGFIEVFRVVFAIWSDAKQDKEISTIAGYLTHCFDYAILTYADGYNSMGCIRKSTPAPNREFGVWICEIEYEIKVRGVT